MLNNQVRHGVLKPALSEDIHTKARAALLTCLTDLSSQSTVITDGMSMLIMCLLL